MYLCNSREDYYASGVTMYTIVNISRCLIILWFVMLATDTSCQTTTKPCVDLQLTNGSEDNVVQENEDGDVHITFVLLDNCPGSSTRALVKLLTQGTDRGVDLCTVVYQNNTCNVTDKPIGHHCINTNHSHCSISWKVKTTDKLLKLRLTNIITKEEKVISLNITGPPSKKRWTAEIIGISFGVIVAVITAVVVIRTWIFRGCCTEKPVTEHSPMTTWHVSVRQTHQNTGKSSRSQAQLDIQSRPGFDLQLTSGSEDNVVQANEEGYVHITFVLSDNCTDSSTRALVKLSTQGEDRAVDMCTVVYQNNTCYITDKPLGHHCLNTEHNPCSISWKVKTADKLLKLRLSNMITKEDKVISLNITGPATKNLGTPDIFGICCGVIVAVTTAAVIIRKYIFKGSCARQLRIQVKEDRQATSSNVAARQSRRNTWSSSGRQAQEDTQVRPSSLDHPGSQQQLVSHQKISSIPAIPKRKRRIYDHIVQPGVTTTRTVEDVYNHIQPSTHKPLSRQKAVNSYNPDAIATRGKTQKHRHAPLARNIVIRREAELYNHSTSFSTTTHGSKREELSHTSPNSSRDKFTRNPGQLQFLNTSSSLKELRSPEQLYNHAIPSRMSVGSSPSDSGCLTIVQFKTVSPMKQEQLCNNDTLSNRTVARSLDQLYNHIGRSSSPRSERDKQNPTTQRPYSVGQEPVQSERTLYDQAVLPTNYRRQVVRSMYDYVSY